MTFLSIGDLARSFQNQRFNIELKTTLQRLSSELASGQKSDISTAISGDFLPIVSLERSLKTINAYATATAESTLFASSMQTALQQIQTQSSDIAPSLLTAGTSESAEMIETTSADARLKFNAVLSALNVRVADRYLFSGTDTDSSAMASVDTVMNALQTAISAETTAVGIASVVDDWFIDPSGFETVGYLGSSNTLSRIPISEEENVSFTVTAASDDIRGVLKGFALASLVTDGPLVGNTTEQAALARFAGEQLLSSQSQLSVVRAKIGSLEEKIDNVTANNNAKRASFEIARANITAIDPYRTATELQAVQIQLETFYTLTARLSRLTLAEYLR